MKDLFKALGYKYLGPAGLNCPCCDNKLSHKRKSRIRRNLFSKLRRTQVKKDTQNEINQIE